MLLSAFVFGSRVRCEHMFIAAGNHSLVWRSVQTNMDRFIFFVVTEVAF